MCDRSLDESRVAEFVRLRAWPFRLCCHVAYLVCLLLCALRPCFERKIFFGLSRCSPGVEFAIEPSELKLMRWVVG